MRISCVIGHCRRIRTYLRGVPVLLLPLVAQGQQAPPPVPTRPAPVIIVAPSPAVQFQHTAQQQQVRDQLQKNQLQLQLQQSVSDNIKRPLPLQSAARRQVERADAARQNRHDAAQQDLLDQYQRIHALPPVPQVRPASSSSGP